MRNYLLAMLFGLTAMAGCAGQPPFNGPDVGPPARCEDVATRNHLTVLTINLLFREIDTRDQRLGAIAEFAAGIPVDVILLQEVVGGALVDTGNSARDLQQMLKARGVGYNLRTAFEAGLPGLLALANAVLSRCEIDFKIVKRLPRASEIQFEDRVIKLGRNVLMTRLDVPGFGKLNVYNTHLCAACTLQEHQTQLQVLLDVVAQVETFFPGDQPHILGGDFNIDRFRTDPPERGLYDTIVSNAGFTDAYAANRNVEELCADPAVPDEHCTKGVTELDPSGARRIDYIFVKTFALNAVRESRVVFNTLVHETQPTVSDHAGVVVSLELP